MTLKQTEVSETGKAGVAMQPVAFIVERRRGDRWNRCWFGGHAVFDARHLAEEVVEFHQQTASDESEFRITPLVRGAE